MEIPWKEESKGKEKYERQVEKARILKLVIDRVTKWKFQELKQETDERKMIKELIQEGHLGGSVH